MAGEGTAWTRSQHLGGRQQCSCACVPRAVRITREGASEPGGPPLIGTRTTHNPGTAAPAKDQTHDIRRGPHGSNDKALESEGIGERKAGFTSRASASGRAWRDSIVVEGQPRGKTNTRTPEL